MRGSILKRRKVDDQRPKTKDKRSKIKEG